MLGRIELVPQVGILFWIANRAILFTQRGLSYTCACD